jgi:hypothetical protein
MEDEKYWLTKPAIRLAVYFELPSIDPATLDPVLITSRYGKVIEGIFYGICYYSLPDHLTWLNMVLKASFIRPEYHQLYYIGIMVINHNDIYPHTDSFSKMAMNFYVETLDCTTTFYDEPPGCDASTGQLEGQREGKIYHRHKLEINTQIKAQPNEVWLLNTRRIHSVECEKMEAKKFRVAYTLQGNVSYEDSIRTLLPSILRQHSSPWCSSVNSFDSDRNSRTC